MREIPIVLLSVHSEHASNIYNGSKTAELRKTFPKGKVSIVVLYETDPIKKITGFFIVKQSSKLSIELVTKLAEQNGVPEHRTIKYFDKRKEGWIVLIEKAFKISNPIPLTEIQSLDHYFRAPLTFCYLYKDEGLTQIIFNKIIEALKGNITLRDISQENLNEFSELVLEEVGKSYEETGKDYLNQIIYSGNRNAFSTASKKILELCLFDIIVGYTVLTIKDFNAIKSGPTIIKHKFRGLGLGTVIRQAILQYCKTKDVRKLYCTAPSNQPNVISYLLNSGLNIEGRLISHLSSNRDEFVFGKLLKQKTEKTYLEFNTPVMEGLSTIKYDTITEPLKSFISNHFESNYFPVTDNFFDNLNNSVQILTINSYSYSDKPKILIVSSLNNEIKAVSILSLKRSNMLKINIITSDESENIIKANLSYIIEHYKNYRRLYLTVSQKKLVTLKCLLDLGFNLEGIIEKAFNEFDSHFALGKLTL